jgi:hypothetical protein
MAKEKPETPTEPEHKPIDQNPSAPDMSGRIGQQAAAAEVIAKKKRRSRKKKEKEPEVVTVAPEQARKSAEQITRFAIEMPCRQMAKFIDPIYKRICDDPDFTFAISEDERALWIEAGQAVLETFPFDRFSKSMPWLSLGFAALITGAPRVSVILTIRKYMKAVKQEQAKEQNVTPDPGKSDHDNGN